MIIVTQIKNIKGKIYGFLKVEELAYIKNRKSYWKCKCLLCGKEIVLRKDSFIYPYSHTKSCGCLREYRNAKRDKKGRFIK